LRISVTILSVAILLSPALSAESSAGSVCISPIPQKPTNTSAPGLSCDAAKLSMKIDAQQQIAWPIKDSVKIDSFDVTATHRVVVFCHGKPQQSFKFRFSDFKARELCLFINDMYKTAQLWSSKGAPWCKCKKA
jgi:hypothetical protein